MDKPLTPIEINKLYKSIEIMSTDELKILISNHIYKYPKIIRDTIIKESLQRDKQT
jgi:hypothetical protein